MVNKDTVFQYKSVQLKSSSSLSQRISLRHRCVTTSKQHF